MKENIERFNRKIENKDKNKQSKEWEPKLDKKTNEIKCWGIKLKKIKQIKKRIKKAIKKIRSKSGEKKRNERKCWEEKLKGKKTKKKIKK